MRTASIITGAALAIGFSLSGVAIQSAYAATDATVTCGDYMKLSAADQDAAFKMVMAAMPTPSLATSTTATTSGNSAKAKATPPMDAGAVVSACQAASPSSTVMDAVTKAMPATAKSGG